ncbi:MAG: Uma2 family endonuclease [Fimbriiglobus sp.]
MSTTLPSIPLRADTTGLRKFTVDEYEKMVAIGVITEDDRLELLEGYLVHKMGHNPPHDGTIQLVYAALACILPAGWCLRVQSVVRLVASEPEPDLVVVRGHPRSFTRQHPLAADIGLVVEIADSTLASDRADKMPIYASNSVPVYWIVNLQTPQIEVYSLPTAGGYQQCDIHTSADHIPLLLAGAVVAQIPVVDLLP